jgi:septal ring factor EnvC (AmiA/AmiB activator)
MSAGRGPLVVALIATFALAMVRGSSVESKQRDLERIREELSRKNREHSAVEKEERELSEEAERVARKLRSSRNSLSRVEEDLTYTERRRKNLEERLWASRLGIDQRQDLLTDEMAAYYRRSRSAPDSRAGELILRRAALTEKTQSLAFAVEHHTQVVTLRNELVDVEGELETLRRKKEAEEKRLSSTQSDVGRLRRSAKGRRALLEKEIAQLNESAAAFEKLITRLLREEQTARAKAAAGPAEVRARPHRGQLPWPVEGPVVQGFGKTKHPELDTFVFSNGVTLRPKSAGAAVRAVEGGDVLFAGPFLNYGLMALVSHPRGLHTIYAHLGSLQVARGQDVGVGQSLGLAGEDDQGRPAVYFEIRRDGAAEDPLLWLQ